MAYFIYLVNEMPDLAFLYLSMFCLVWGTFVRIVILSTRLHLSAHLHSIPGYVHYRVGEQGTLHFGERQAGEGAAMAHNICKRVYWTAAIP